MRHFDPLRPNRFFEIADKYEFAHGTDSLCVYDADNLKFVTEIPVGKGPDCHATNKENTYVYLATLDGLCIISQDTLEVVKTMDLGPVYATSMMMDGETLIVHDNNGGFYVLKEINDINKIHVYKHVDVFPKTALFYQIGGKGAFINDNNTYLLNGWLSPKIYTIDIDKDYKLGEFVTDSNLLLSDDLVVSKDKSKTYSAIYNFRKRSYISVTDNNERKVIKTIATGDGTCGLTMTNDERYVVCSNDLEESISVIDTQTDELVNKISAKKGFEELGITGFIQGISVAADGDIFVYGCEGNGAIVKFHDVANGSTYTISTKDGKIYDGISQGFHS